jgi:hypothetical protein
MSMVMGKNVVDEWVTAHLDISVLVAYVVV